MHGRLIVLAAGATIAGSAPAANAADSTTYRVSSTGDTVGACSGTSCPSIRSALAQAASGDTIELPAGNYELTGGPLLVTRDVAIVGAGARDTVLEVAADGQGGRVFEVGNDTGGVEAVISHLTMRGGIARNGAGGNLLNAGRLTLDHVRVTGGFAGFGGGIANAAGSLLIERSLIDGNVAGGAEGGVGGGVYSAAASPGALEVRDSTITGNQASGAGGALAVDDYSGLSGIAGTLAHVTLAGNAAPSAGGVAIGRGVRVDVGASIIAANTVLAARVRSAATLVSDCDPNTPPADTGGNLSDAADCGFATAPADPRLASRLAPAGGETDILRLAPDSPAIDLAGPCTGADQRDVHRPQGAACDAGAYELAAPMIASGPEGTTLDPAPAFTFSSPDAPSFECRLDGPGDTGSAWAPCSSPKTFTGLAPGAYVFSVRAAGGTAPAAVRSFTIAPAPTPIPLPAPSIAPPAPPARAAHVPPPVYHRTVVVVPTRGTVKVRLPGSRRYVVLQAGGDVPLGASIDVRKGRIVLTAARSRSGVTESATFFGGVFRVTQTGTLTQLALRGPVPRCGSSSSSAKAQTARKPKKRKRRTRRLWGDGSGSFRTRGHYSAATVRGTRWLVEDTCHSTVTRVARGSVKVRDFIRHKTIVLRAGRRYVAHRG